MVAPRELNSPDLPDPLDLKLPPGHHLHLEEAWHLGNPDPLDPALLSLPANPLLLALAPAFPSVLSRLLVSKHNGFFSFLVLVERAAL